MHAVNSADAETLLGLYDRQAVLIPTFSNRLLNTPEKLREYFVMLGSRDELSIALHERTLIVQTLHNEISSLSGIYNWRFAVDGELLNFEMCIRDSDQSVQTREPRAFRQYGGSDLKRPAA